MNNLSQGRIRFCRFAVRFFAALVLLLSSPTVSHSQSNPVWQSRVSAANPSARYYMPMVYNSSLQKVILFGGWDSSVKNDTWSWDGTEWIRILTTTNPDARYKHSMAYDSVRGRVVIFGGIGATSRLQDTWEFDGVNWTLMTPAHKPPARDSASMVYDQQRGKVILFGGFKGGTPSNLNDTWQWDGTDWQQITTAHAPSARNGHAMQYDPVAGVTLLFGGFDTTRLNDTWLWNGSDWDEMPLTTKPTVRNYHTITWDSFGNRLLLFGGIETGTDYKNDLWAWQNDQWTQIVSAASPPVRASHGTAFDPVLGQLVLFGGSGGGPRLGDTWIFGEYTGPQPTLAPTSIPTVRPSASPSLMGSPTISPVATVSAVPSSSPTLSPSQSATPSASPTISQSPSPSATASPTLTLSASPTVSPSPSESATLSPSESPTLATTPTLVPSDSPTPSLSPEPTVSSTVSASPTVSPTSSATPSLTPQVTATISPSPTFTPTATNTPLPTQSASPEPTLSPEPSPQELSTRTPTVSPSPIISKPDMYNLTGTVINNNVPVPGIFVSAGLLGSGITDQNGQFSFLVKSGAEYTLRFSRTGWVLLPSARTGVASDNQTFNIEGYANPTTFGGCSVKDVTSKKLSVDATLIEFYNYALFLSATNKSGKVNKSVSRRLVDLKAKTLLALKQNLSIPEVFLSCSNTEGCVRAELGASLAKTKEMGLKLLAIGKDIAKASSPSGSKGAAQLSKFSKQLEKRHKALKRALAQIPSATYFCS